MLRRSAGLPARRVHGDLAAMPFEGSSFDIVACAWALETLDDPGAGFRELVRVLRPGGRACVACCADRPGMDALDRLATMAMRLRGTGRLLSPSDLVAGAGPGTRVRPIPCGGPAAVLLMEKPS
jgi:SAM-dependent methyltransferase